MSHLLDHFGKILFIGILFRQEFVPFTLEKILFRLGGFALLCHIAVCLLEIDKRLKGLNLVLGGGYTVLSPVPTGLGCEEAGPKLCQLLMLVLFVLYFGVAVYVILPLFLKLGRLRMELNIESFSLLCLVLHLLYQIF